MKKSTHRGFRGPNNFLLARPIFSSRNRTSFFRRRIDRCRCLDRSRCSNTIEKIIPFAICSPTEIDASRFSGPERFFACAPYIPFKKSNVVFSTPDWPMPMPRSIAVLENGRKSHNRNSFSALFAITGSLSTLVFISSYCASVSFPSLAHCAYKKWFYCRRIVFILFRSYVKHVLIECILQLT